MLINCFRPYDNVPRNALAQEITANRLNIRKLYTKL